MLGRMLFRRGEFSQAAEVYAAWLGRDPDNPVARHMAAALSGTHVPPRADDRYVASVFDQYAASFDDHLQQLGYRAPELVAANLAPHLEPARRRRSSSTPVAAPVCVGRCCVRSAVGWSASTCRPA